VYIILRLNHKHIIPLLHDYCICRVIVVRLMSAAGTGFYYTMKRQRVKERMMLRKYDPIG